METRVKGKLLAFRGDEAVAEAMRQINPDVVAAYPITPQTETVQAFSQFVANGEVDTEFIAVESEHAAMSACIGAAAAGGRAQTATSGPGLALMWEMLWVASGMRLPIVMPVVNRTLSAPINILCDHSDSMGARDAGWLQLYAESMQEAYDNTIQAVRIAEHPRVMLPIMSCLDGFILGHSFEPIEILPDEAVREFVGTYKPGYSLLDVDHPVTYGPIDFHGHFFEHKRQQVDGMESAPEVVLQVGREFGELTGRYYGLTEGYELEDADFVIVALGSVTGTIKTVVDDLRQQGQRVGLLRIRCFRPFPAQEIAQALGNKKAVAVLDRSLSFGAQAHQVYLEVVTALYTHGYAPKVVNYVYGIGGRDTLPHEVEQVYRELAEVDKTGVIQPVVRYLTVRE
ncbi:MAG TPA: pyruvate ferredoxin oxidoreductase [Dehalococcoidia bacterium]|nr:pyruvate ferredoxin oxidoreductase [Dehalococcoidia bacterium]